MQSFGRGQSQRLLADALPLGRCDGSGWHNCDAAAESQLQQERLCLLNPLVKVSTMRSSGR